MARASDGPGRWRGMGERAAIAAMAAIAAIAASAAMGDSHRALAAGSISAYPPARWQPYRAQPETAQGAFATSRPLAAAAPPADAAGGAGAQDVAQLAGADGQGGMAGGPSFSTVRDVYDTYDMVTVLVLSDGAGAGFEYTSDYLSRADSPEGTGAMSQSDYVRLFEDAPDRDVELDIKPIPEPAPAGAAPPAYGSGAAPMAPASKDIAAREYEATEEEVAFLAKLIYHEAHNQPRLGKAAVGEVVMNRVFSPKFPQSTIYSVIVADGQFTGAKNLWGIVPGEEEIEVARNVISGTEAAFGDPDVLFFRNPMITSGIRPSTKSDWGRFPWHGYIGDHAFYTSASWKGV